MLGYGKMSASAVAAMSALAEKHGENKSLSSLDIAQMRNLSQPLIAKILTTLSRAGYVIGMRGQGGGYRLGKEPSEISVFEIVDLFEGHRDTNACPFGPGWCQVKNPCPMHETLFGLKDHAEEILEKNTFAIFCKGQPGAK